MAKEKKSITLNEKELTILINHLRKEYGELIIKYKPRKTEVLARLNFEKEHAKITLSKKKWGKWSGINDHNIFPQWQDVNETFLKLSISRVEGLNQLITDLKSHSYQILGIDTNMLYFLLFSRHLFPALRMEKIGVPQIAVPDLVIKELNNAINQEDKRQNRALNQKHKLRLHPKLTRRKRRALVARSELSQIPQHVGLPHINVNEKRNSDQLIVEALENYAQKVRGRLLVLSKDRDVTTMAKNYQLDAMLIEFEPPPVKKRWPISAFAEFLYLLTVELAILLIEEICTVDIAKIGNNHEAWEQRMINVTFEESFDQTLKKDIFKDVKVARKINQILKNNSPPHK